MTPQVPLPARLDVSTLAWRAVGAASAAAAELAGAEELPPDPDRIAVAYTSERHMRIDGVAQTAFAPLSGFFRTRDGWVRTHGNYPHHAAALRRALGLAEDAGKDAAAAALADLEAEAAATAITAAGGLCVVVAPEHPDQDAALRGRPLVQHTRIGAARALPLPGGPRDAPLRGIRVLDLTRVIAGPIATRTLALLGADVLRIDPPRLPEPPWQHLDTGHGKRSALLDLTASVDRARFEDLLTTADVVALGYRPAALDRLGLSPEALAERHPGLVVARLTAWGEPDRRGFDSLVQAASGIALAEGAPDAPGALPAQALDHSAGYLLAAAIMAALGRRAQDGGSHLVETSLRRISAELLGMPRTADRTPTVGEPDPARHVQSFDLAGTTLVTAAPALAYDGGPARFAPPRPWGEDAPVWST